jgi:hypothetical protein
MGGGVGMSRRPADHRVPTEITFETVVRAAVSVLSPTLAGQIDRLAIVMQNVFANTTVEDRDAMLSVFRLNGAEGVRQWLDEKFREPTDPEGATGLFLPFRFVRIDPKCPREVHIIKGVCFRKEAGWHRVSRALAAACAMEPLYAEAAVSPPVFEVSTDPPAGRSVELDR